MARVSYPGVYIEETGRGPKPIEGVPTSTAAFLGETSRGPALPRLVTSFADYERHFGSRGPYLPDAVRGFFENGGKRAFICRLTAPRKSADTLLDRLKRGLSLLEAPAFDEVALVAAPGLVEADLVNALVDHCEAQRRFAVIDCPRAEPGSLHPMSVRQSRNAAAYAPWLEVAGRIVPPSGHVLGTYARTDIERGVWKAPAGVAVRGVDGLEHAIDDDLQEVLNPRGVNAIRRFVDRGILLWGARTLSSDSEWKYVNVRRLLLFVERSIDRGTQWVVFERNDSQNWARVVDLVERFLVDLWRAGGLAGVKPQEAFYVICDQRTMTQDDIDTGRLICVIGVAPLRPAEYIILRIGQWTVERDP